MEKLSYDLSDYSNIPGSQKGWRLFYTNVEKFLEISARCILIAIATLILLCFCSFVSILTFTHLANTLSTFYVTKCWEGSDFGCWNVVSALEEVLCSRVADAYNINRYREKNDIVQRWQKPRRDVEERSTNFAREEERVQRKRGTCECVTFNAAHPQVCALPRPISGGIYVFLKFILNILRVLTPPLFRSPNLMFLNIQWMGTSYPFFSLSIQRILLYFSPQQFSPSKYII